MSISVSEAEIQKLIRHNRRVVQSLGQNFIGGLDLEAPATGVALYNPDRALSQLETRSQKWADRNIVRTYNASRRSVERSLRSSGQFLTDTALDKKFESVHRDSVNSLVNNPTVGFMSGIRRSGAEIRNRVHLIKSQLASLGMQRELINSSIARVGSLGKENLNTIRNGIVNELTGAGAVTDHVYRNKFKMLGPQNLFSNIANVGFVTYPDGKGGVRHIRLDKYTENLARTKAAQAITSATRNTLLRHGHELIQVTRIKSKEGDFCDAYAGKVFALTKRASMQWGVSHVSQLPNGGSPFHPNCRHRELPYFPKVVSNKQRKRDMSPPPAWSIDRPMGEVQAIYTGSKKTPGGSLRSLHPLGPGMADWDPRVLSRMRGEPIGKLRAGDKTYAGALKRLMSDKGVASSRDLLVLGGLLNARLSPLYINELQKSGGLLREFKKDIRLAHTRFKNRGPGEVFPDFLSQAYLSSAAGFFDAYQDHRKGFNPTLERKSVSTLSKVRSMGVGPGKEGGQLWTTDSPKSLVRKFNKTLSYFPTSWLLKSRRAGQLQLLEDSRKADFGFSFYKETAPKKSILSISSFHARLPSVTQTGIFLYLMSLRIKGSMPELRAFEEQFWDRLGPREKEEMLELLGHASSDIESDFVPELFASGVQSVFGYNTDGLSREKLNSFVLGTYAGVP